jgi:hypothetical protein
MQSLDPQHDGKMGWKWVKPSVDKLNENALLQRKMLEKLLVIFFFLALG